MRTRMVRSVRTAVQRAAIERAGGARDRDAGRVQQDDIAAVWRGRRVVREGGGCGRGKDSRPNPPTTTTTTAGCGNTTASD